MAGVGAQQAQALAQQAGFSKAEAQVHHLAGNHKEALSSFLSTSTVAAFEYLETALSASSLKSAELASIWAAIKEMLVALVTADSLAFARLVVTRFPEERESIIASLAASPEMQFRYCLIIASPAPESSSNQNLTANMGLGTKYIPSQ